MPLALIASAGTTANEYLARHVAELGYPRPVIVASGGEARRRLGEKDFAVVVINTPLPDEFGHELAQTAACDTLAGVILLAKAEVADSVAEKVEDDGVFVIPKPLSRVLFLQALRMTRAARSRLTGLRKENRRLQQRIENIRLVDRAKCLLIECCSMSEPEAHAYIEQQAMNQRRTKREIAEHIISGGTPE